LSDATIQALEVGAAAFIVGSDLVAATIVGGTFALVSQVTKPYFRESGTLSFILNMVMTSALINLSSKHFVILNKAACATFLPASTVIKIIAVVAIFEVIAVVGLALGLMVIIYQAFKAMCIEDRPFAR
jgi:hypothetical protein